MERASWFGKLNSDLAISILLFRARPVLLNGLFIAYLIWGQPQLMERLNASQDGRGDWQLGGLLLIVPLVEIIGIRLKRPVSAYFAWRYPRQGTSVYLVVVYIHTAVFRLALGFFYSGCWATCCCWCSRRWCTPLCGISSRRETGQTWRQWTSSA